jgi:hypothetical protein
VLACITIGSRPRVRVLTAQSAPDTTGLTHPSNIAKNAGPL